MPATLEETPSGTEHRTALPPELRTAAADGISAVRRRDFETGYRVLGDVCDQIRRRGEKLPAWIISYYGLTLAMQTGRVREAAELCQGAIDAEPMKADYYANLAEVCLAGRQRRKAMSALQRGLAIDSRNVRLRELQAGMGTRREPVIARLDRSHPVNVVLGRIRHAVASSPPPPARAAGRKKGG